jgi:hypothetical protein
VTAAPGEEPQAAVAGERPLYFARIQPATPAEMTVAATTARIVSHECAISPRIGSVNACAIVRPMMPCGAASALRGSFRSIPFTAAAMATTIDAINQAAGTRAVCASQASATVATASADHFNAVTCWEEPRANARVAVRRSSNAARWMARTLESLDPGTPVWCGETRVGAVAGVYGEGNARAVELVAVAWEQRGTLAVSATEIEDVDEHGVTLMHDDVHFYDDLVEFSEARFPTVHKLG